MDLPTYTNIWRIEKRLYKLYDLRLPMPLPLGQIAAFVGITVPYVLFLTLIGIPFSHNLFWLYVLPPGVLTWLVLLPFLKCVMLGSRRSGAEWRHRRRRTRPPWWARCGTPAGGPPRRRWPSRLAGGSRFPLTSPASRRGRHPPASAGPPDGDRPGPGVRSRR